MLADDVGYGHVWVEPEINKMLPTMRYSGDSEVYRGRKISRSQTQCHRKRLLVVPAYRPLELRRPHAYEAGARRVGCDAPGLDQDLKGPDDTVGAHRTL